MQIRHNDMILDCAKNDNKFSQLSFAPSMDMKTKKTNMPLFQMSIAGENSNNAHDYAIGFTNLPWDFDVEDIKDDNKKTEITYLNKEKQIEVKVFLNKNEGSNSFRCHTEVLNKGEENVIITHLSSAFFAGIASGGILRFDDPKKIRVHYAYQNWQAEAQWRSNTLNELGMFATGEHRSNSSIQFSSKGTYSSSRYLPMIILEDLENDQVWYMEFLSSTNWHFGIGYNGNPLKDDGTLFMHADGADERDTAFYRTLKPGEKFISIEVNAGCTKGGFEKAVWELNKARRNRKIDYKKMPVVFNDFLNCLSADPTEEKLILLIDSAKEVGCEYFCIDAGWFGPKDPPFEWGNMLGDWNISEDRFPDKGLNGIIDYITKRGMVPGLWLEMEVCGYKSDLSKKPDDWFLRRHGKRIGENGPRQFLDFRNSKVRDYLHKKIDKLIEMGIGYIKNDYNQCVGIGIDNDNGSFSNGLIDHIRAFYSFIDEVRNNHPDLIIENCNSGAMREDQGILSHFHLQSTSDQEEMWMSTSVVMGQFAQLLPEQAGIWASIYPIHSKDMKNEDLFATDEYIKRFGNGDETVYTLVNAMSGVLYLSGRIDKANSLNIELVKEAVSIYKDKRDFIMSSNPIWPTGMLAFGKKSYITSFGLVNDERSKILLYVFSRKSVGENINISMFKDRKIKNVKRIFPKDEKYNIKYNHNNNDKITFVINKELQAGMFEIDLIGE